MDPGLYAFQSKKFQQVFPHKIHLIEVVCQDKENYIKAINELCSGHPSVETVTFLKSLNWPIVTDRNMEFIFGTRFDVDMFNHDKLQQIQGNMSI